MKVLMLILVLLLRVIHVTAGDIAAYVSQDNPDGLFVFKHSHIKEGFHPPATIQVNRRLLYTIFAFSNHTRIYTSYSKNFSTEHIIHNIEYPDITNCSFNHLSFEQDFTQLELKVTSCERGKLGHFLYTREIPWSNTIYCDESSAFEGIWAYDNLKNVDDLEVCPRIFNNTVNSRSWAIYPSKGPIFTAFFYPNHNCYVLPFQKSLEIYQKLTGKKTPMIATAGDSLLRQLVATSECDMELLLDIPANLNKLGWNMFLRDKVPCLKNLFEHEAFEGSESESLVNFKSWQLNKPMFSWLYELANDSDILILNTGAWYSPQHLHSNETTACYLETLLMLKPHLEDYVRSHPKTTVFWLSLPWIIPSKRHVLAHFSYDQFEYRNKIVQTFLPSGVIYLDVEKFSKERKVKDEFLSSDHIHWVSPGTFTIPSFLIERILHLHLFKSLKVDGSPRSKNL